MTPWRAGCGDLKVGTDHSLNGALFLHSRFQLAYLALFRSVAKSPSVFCVLLQSVLQRCNSMQEGNVSFIMSQVASSEKWN